MTVATAAAAVAIPAAHLAADSQDAALGPPARAFFLKKFIAKKAINAVAIAPIATFWAHCQGVELPEDPVEGTEVDLVFGLLATLFAALLAELTPLPPLTPVPPPWIFPPAVELTLVREPPS
jgi:hypothetical protein